MPVSKVPEAPAACERAMAAAASDRFLSPLRYPGGKRILAGRIGAFMDRQGPSRRETFFEPFAGGAAASLAAVRSGVVRRAVLNDLDPLVASFWLTVFDARRARFLADRILDARVDLATWDRERASTGGDLVDRAFRCLFLNRTSFSGVLSGTSGPIGGRRQTGTYRIGCRWNAPGLALRIMALSKIGHRFIVENLDFRDFIQSHRSDAGGVWYVDPPYFEKADRLYRHWFTSADHEDLAKALGTLDTPWLLSCDDVTQAREIYGQRGRCETFGMPHGAAAIRNDRRLVHELLVESQPDVRQSELSAAA